jgi:hypothetical protein
VIIAAWATRCFGGVKDAVATFLFWGAKDAAATFLCGLINMHGLQYACIHGKDSESYPNHCIFIQKLFQPVSSFFCKPRSKIATGGGLKPWHLSCIYPKDTLCVNCFLFTFLIINRPTSY